jgi:hypothetical protein
MPGTRATGTRSTPTTPASPSSSTGLAEKTPPTYGGHDHRAEAQRFCAAFPDNRVHNQPYAILLAERDYTCFVTRFTGTFTSPLELPDANSIQPTGKAFDVLYSTTARWKDGRIIEEYLFYDNGTFLSQIGLA